MDHFVEFVWRGTPDAARKVEESLERACDEAGEHPLGVLSPNPTALCCRPNRVARRSDEQEPPDALDPALAATVEHANYWGGRLGPFSMVYASSTVVDRWSTRLLAMADPEIAAMHNVSPSHQMPVLKLRDLRAAESVHSPAIQIADVLAGASAELLRALINGDEFSAWQEQLRDARIFRWLKHPAWPRDPAFADELARQEF